MIDYICIHVVCLDFGYCRISVSCLITDQKLANIPGKIVRTAVNIQDKTVAQPASEWQASPHQDIDLTKRSTKGVMDRLLLEEVPPPSDYEQTPIRDSLRKKSSPE